MCKEVCSKQDKQDILLYNVLIYSGGAGMFKLIIVDDERLDREGLRQQIDWERMNVTSVETARNGFEALELIKEFKPDILITDIKMPGMDGLTLSEKAVDLVPWIKIIIISGYDDFEYVRNAMKIKAYEYILKPVDTDELIIALKTVIEERLKEKKAEEETKILLDSVNESKYLLRRSLFLDIIYGNIDNSSIWKKIEQLELGINRGSYYIAVIEIDDAKFLSDKLGKNSYKELMKSIENCIRNVNTNGCSIECQVIDEARLAAIFSFLGDSLDDSVNSAQFAAEQIIVNVKNKCDISVTVGISIKADSLEKLHICYDLGCRALSQKISRGKGRVLAYYDRNNPRQETIDTQKVTNQLVAALKNSDGSKVEYLINRFFENLMASGIDNKKYILNCCINILSGMENVLLDLNDSTDNVFGQGYILWESFFEYETIEEIRENMRSIFRQVITYLQNRNDKKNRRIVDMVTEYIEDNYAKELTLKDIAAHFYYSPNYLGAIFKEELGKGFADYLIELRIRKAAEVLRHSNLKIYEVANMVGYRNIPSFINQFKLIHNITPKEYKERF